MDVTLAITVIISRICFTYLASVRTGIVTLQTRPYRRRNLQQENHFQYFIIKLQTETREIIDLSASAAPRHLWPHQLSLSQEMEK